MARIELLAFPAAAPDETQVLTNPSQDSPRFRAATMARAEKIKINRFSCEVSAAHGPRNSTTREDPTLCVEACLTRPRSMDFDDSNREPDVFHDRHDDGDVFVDWMILWHVTGVWSRNRIRGRPRYQWPRWRRARSELSNRSLVER